jgi:hypothetical protein
MLADAAASAAGASLARQKLSATTATPRSCTNWDLI